MFNTFTQNNSNNYDGSPERTALRTLLDEAYGTLGLGGDKAFLYALSWLAMGRMLTRGDIPGYRDIQNLLAQECWVKAKGLGLPDEAFSLVWPHENTVRYHDGDRVRILGLLTRFLEQSSDKHWNLADAANEVPGTHEGGYDGGLCDALVELLDAQSGSRIWIPFDVAGQLTCRALRKGMKVTLAGPVRNESSTLVARLLSVIEGQEENLTVEYEPKSTSETVSHREFDYLIACPPIGMKIVPGTGWHRWDVYGPMVPGAEAIYKKISGRNIIELDRAESWAVAAFWPRVKHRAVFLTGPNILFAKGQEQRVREYLIHGSRQPAAVVMLPPRLVHMAGITTALTLLDRGNTTQSVRMVDATSITIESNSTMRFSRKLHAAEVVRLVRETEEVAGVAKNIAIDQIASQECNLMPIRYLKALSIDDEDRVPLGTLVARTIRAPVASKEATALEVAEVGIGDLGRWGHLKRPFLKTTTVQQKKLGEYALTEGDIIISIKGTLGKVGIVGQINNITPPEHSWSERLKLTWDDDIDVENPVVCAQNVIAIRPDLNHVRPLALYLYLRSEDFRNQLEAFRVGVAVSHITPTTLLQEVKVPTRILLASTSAEKQFAELCDLESEVERVNQRIEEIRNSL